MPSRSLISGLYYGAPTLSKVDQLCGGKQCLTGWLTGLAQDHRAQYRQAFSYRGAFVRYFWFGLASTDGVVSEAKKRIERKRVTITVQYCHITPCSGPLIEAQFPCLGLISIIGNFASASLLPYQHSQQSMQG